jgi:4-hydroxy-tetrahydrodipicolinate synthase
MDTQRLQGLGIALATPFLPAPDSATHAGSGTGRRMPQTAGAGAIDIPAYRRLVRHVVAGGADFLVVLGSTGEAATVLPEERDTLIKTALDECGGRPVVVGTGHNSTVAAAELAARAAELGADALLVVTPYYNKPQPAGLEAHYRFVSSAAPDLPIIVYNVPGRTGLNLLPKDLARLWAIDRVVAVKESSGNLAQPSPSPRSRWAPRVSSPSWAISCPPRRRPSSTLLSPAAVRKPSPSSAGSCRSWMRSSSNRIPYP